MAEISLRLAGDPVGMAGEKAVDEADVVGNIQAKNEADEAGANDEAAIQPSETISCIRKR